MICSTRSVPREEKNMNNFLEASKDKWLENSFEVGNKNKLTNPFVPRSWILKRWQYKCDLKKDIKSNDILI